METQDIHYIISIDGEQYGPYDLEQVRQFGVFKDTLIQRPEISEEWFAAEDCPEIAAFLSVEEIDSQPELSNTVYYYFDGISQYGPFSILELSFLDISANSLISLNSPGNYVEAHTIHGLLDMLHYISDSENPIPSEELDNCDKLSIDDFKKLIEEQETEIINLQHENAELKNNDSSTNPLFDTPFDFSSKPEEIFAESVTTLKEHLNGASSILVSDEDASYSKVFKSKEAEIAFYTNQYNQRIETLMSYVKKLSETSKIIQEVYDDTTNHINL